MFLGRVYGWRIQHGVWEIGYMVLILYRQKDHDLTMERTRNSDAEDGYHGQAMDISASRDYWSFCGANRGRFCERERRVMIVVLIARVRR